MEFTIIGSAGCVCTPKPTCQCGVCVQARTKGYPYARCGCSIYLKDISMLVDTPEDIAIALNNADIRTVHSIIYSHCDPDHIMGMRVVEQLRLEWLNHFEDIKPDNPITIYADSDVMWDLNNIQNRYGSFFDYYEHMELVNRKTVEEPVVIGGITITPIPVPQNNAVSVIVFEQNEKKLVYAPCDCKPFPVDEILHNADVLILGNTFVGDVLKNGRKIGENHHLRRSMHSMEGVINIKEEFNIGRVIITHIEEDWGKSYDDYLELEKEYDGIQFAYDGLIVEV